MSILATKETHVVIQSGCGWGQCCPSDGGVPLYD